MSSTKSRTSFALDSQTISLLRSLSRRWNVSQAEVVRRSVRMAAERENETSQTVQERLAAYHASGGLRAAEADAYLREVAEDRHSWRRRS